MEYGDYFFSEEGTCLRMYGGTKSPSLLPKYATDYIVHKEAIRQLFLDGFGSFLFLYEEGGLLANAFLCWKL